MMSRRHNDPQTPHERARTLGSDRLDLALTVDDAAWLERHLATCPDCAAVVEAYARDRRLLRSMPAPEAPRDLWARTSVVLDRERGRRAPAPPARARVRRWEAAAGLVAILVVGVLVGRTLLPSGDAPVTGLASPSATTGPLPTGSAAVEATPIAVPPGEVAWVGRSSDGTYAVNIANVVAVCAQDSAPSSECAPLDTTAQRITSLKERPDSVVLAPTVDQAAVVDTGSAATGGSISIVPVARHPAATASPAPTASAEASPTPAASPTERPTAVASPSSSPAASPTAEASTGPSASASPSASVSPEPSVSASPSISPEPSPTASVPPSATPSPLPTPSLATPTDTPAPTLAQALAIIDDVVIVGGAPVYSPDGTWLAFSARPSHGRTGPDVYVWHLGDPKARAITRDHGSVFSAWVDGRILASRGQPAIVDGASPDPTVEVPTSFLLDPASGKEHSIDGFHGWRPVVDPSGTWVVYWTGTLAYDAEARTLVPADGSLVVDRWAAWDGSDPTARSDPQPLFVARPDSVVREWDVRWDPTGRFVGVWIADPLMPTIGRLSLVAIDRDGRVDASARPSLKNVPARPGFAIGDGRLAWATADGQDGEGSRLTVLAWKGPDAGRIRTEAAAPNEDIIVVR